MAKGDYLINGFRNRDLRADLFGVCEDAKERRKQAAKITRWLGMLKAHALIQRVAKTHRYQLTAHRRRVVTAVLSAHNATAEKLNTA